MIGKVAMVAAGLLLKAEGSKARVMAQPCQAHRQLVARRSAALIVPALDEADYLPRLLGSARAQTEPFAELVVIDSSAGPETANVARQLGAQVLPYPKGNLSAARNAGLAATTAEIVVFADADVILESSFLERAITDLERLVIGHAREVIHDSTLLNALFLWRTNLARPRLMTTRCVAARTAELRAIGGYNEACNPREGCREDLELGRRAAALYGAQAVGPLSAMIATSGRRYFAQGLATFSAARWQKPIR